MWLKRRGVGGLGGHLLEKTKHQSKTLNGAYLLQKHCMKLKKYALPAMLLRRSAYVRILRQDASAKIPLYGGVPMVLKGGVVAVFITNGNVT